MGTLDKRGILDAPDLKTETVDVPEWGGQVTVSEMGGLTAMEFYDFILPKDADSEAPVRFDATFKAALVAFTVVDESGQLVFGVEDIPRLARKKAAALNRVFAAADRLNLITNGAREAAGKNSAGGGAGGASSSPSPETSDSPPSDTSPAS